MGIFVFDEILNINKKTVGACEVVQWPNIAFCSGARIVLASPPWWGYTCGNVPLLNVDDLFFFYSFLSSPQF